MEGSAAPNATLVSDPEERLAYFDNADQFTPYLATLADGSLFLVKTEDKHIGRSLFGKQARGELSVLERAVTAIEGLLGPESIADRVFIDVGANIGTTTIPAVRSHGFESAVAIEPEPENFRVLRLNVLLNDLEDRIRTLPLAASNETGQSDLVVNRSRGGKHWIATDPSKLKRKSTGPQSAIVTVETATLDHLVDTGVIDLEATGLLWMDAEAHEGHILAGATSLLERGTPLVLEWNPIILDRMGDRVKLQELVAERYTHFVDMRRNANRDEPKFPLRTVDRLPAYADKFLDRANRSHKTDILVMRLEADQANLGELDQIIRQSATDAESEESTDEDPPSLNPISRLRNPRGRGLLRRRSG